MKRLTKHLGPILFLGATLLWEGAAHGQAIGQWDFNNGDLTQSTGSTIGDMQYYDGSGGFTFAGTVFGTTTALGIPDINGTPAKVMGFPASTNGMGYQLPTLPTGNGGGSAVNQWTIILDLLYPTASDNTDRPIIDVDGVTTSSGNKFFAGSEFGVSASDGIGAPTGPYFGLIQPNTWYRLGMVVDTNLVSFYINGTRVGTTANPGTDTRFAYSTTVPTLVLATIFDTGAEPGYVNSIQVRDVALNPGQMKALGGPSVAGVPITIPPVPAFIQSSSPAAGDAGVAPSPAINVVLNQGDTVVNSSSIKLLFDGVALPASVTASAPTFQVTANVTNLLDPSSVHTLSLIWSDSVAGTSTNTWSFTVTGYQSVYLPTPFYIENFESTAEGSLPTGWVATNATTPESGAPAFDLCNPDSDVYENWIVINTNRLMAGGPCNCFECDTLNQPPIALNGVLIDNIAHGNIAYFESDNRCGNCYGQIGMMFTPEIDCTGRTNVFVSWHSLYTQNQDNIAACEYSIDGGTNWLPVIYYLDDQSPAAGGTPDVIVTNGVIDIGATFMTVRSDQPPGPSGTNYGWLICAPITTNLIPYVAGRTNDDQVSSKRIETVRLTQADGQSHVSFRFVYGGTCSWYWGIDDFGLYEINTPVITQQPLSQTIDAGTPVTFTVVATSSKAVTYQWQYNGINIAGQTNSSYTISSVAPGDAGQYKVIVSNADGPAPSAPATLTVNTTPAITTQPYAMSVAYAGSSFTFNVAVSGGRPLTAMWYRGGTLVSSSVANPSLTLNPVSLSDAGAYTLVLSNSFGTNSSALAVLSVFNGAITNGIATHLKFDGDYKDSSGNATDGSAVGTPGFQAGMIGQAVHISSSGTPAGNPATNNYVTFGTSQLKFGTNDFSVSFWAKVFFQNDDKPFISNKDWGSGGNPGWAIATEGSGMKWNFTDNQAIRRDSLTVASQLENGSWHNVVVTFLRASVGTIYVDGQVADIRNLAPDAGKVVGSSDTALAVNVGQDGTGTYTDGGGAAAVDMLVDDLGVWQRALTPSEAIAIYTAGQAGKDLSQAVVSFAPGQPTLSVTVSGNSLNLSWQGTATSVLQTSPGLSPASWSNVPGTTGASSATVTISGSSAFFRVKQ